MPSFVDYLKGGCEVSLMIAVDFTASNGDPKTQQSLHHLWPEHSGRRNDYQATIETVGGILAAYDADGLVPAFGTSRRKRRPCLVPGVWSISIQFGDRAAATRA